MNWQHRVRERLGACKLAKETCDEVVAELAAHLEQTYDQACADGLSETAAMKLVEQEVDSWRRLARDIRSAKSEEGPMNHRTKSLWLPVLLTFLGASISETVTQFLGVRPQLVWVAKMGMTFYWPWLATLPFFGAAGAYLSQRARGSLLARLAASLSPALIALIVMSLILPWGLYIDGLDFFRLVAFGLGLINWVAIPALALLLGAAPFLKGQTQSQAGR